MALRSITMKLLGDRRWSACAMPVDPDDNPDFYERVSQLLQSPLIKCRWFVAACGIVLANK